MVSAEAPSREEFEALARENQLLREGLRQSARIQEMHITLGQMLCGALEIELGLVKVE